MLDLGGSFSICPADDIVDAAMETACVLYCPVNKQHKLIDFAYTDSDGIHLFQATVGIRHTAKVKEISRVKSQIQELATVQQFRATLYYLVPENRFHSFVTIPENPDKQPSEHFKIYHVFVPNPNNARDRGKFSFARQK